MTKFAICRRLAEKPRKITLNSRLFNILFFLICVIKCGFRGVAGCLFCNYEEEKFAISRGIKIQGISRVSGF